jgi:predicted porin
MKKSLMALAILSATAGVAQAQSSVQIYGNLDAGFVKRSDQTLAIGKRAANTLGFKGTEDLGNGLKALFQLEMRYEPDTGTVENGSRPLFQGQSRVGLAGDFGMVRIGRGVTAYQETIGQFEPWRGLPTVTGFYTDLATAGYTSQPLDVTGSSNNRWSNALWYNSPVIAGFQLNTTFATKEGTPNGTAITGTGSQYPVGAEASAVPFSVSGTYNNGPAALMLGYERNHVESKVWSVAGAVNVMPALKLTALYSKQDRGDILPTAPDSDAWVLGANYTMGPGKILAGYGQRDTDGLAKTKQLSVGYEYSLSKRTYLYVDASRKKGAQNTNVFPASSSSALDQTINTYDVGINHSF